VIFLAWAPAGTQEFSLAGATLRGPVRRIDEQTFELRRGRLAIEFHSDERAEILVETPSARVRILDTWAPRRAQIEIQADERGTQMRTLAGAVTLAVISGSLQVSNPRGELAAMAGDMVRVAQDEPPARGKTTHEVHVLAPMTVAPLGSAGASVIVSESQGPFANAGIEGAEVAIGLADSKGKETPLFQGRTGEHGVLNAQFKIPALEEGAYTMKVHTSSKSGRHVAERQVRVKSGSRILLVTDKPLYQPGQDVNVRGLALDDESLRAVGGEILFEIEDPKGNKVFKRRETLNAFGLAAAELRLADEVNMGDYRITATVGNSKAEKTVTIKKYVLPKFKVQVKAAKSWYLPKETIKGSLQADYFFGKPVAGADVRIEASTFDVDFKQFATVQTRTGPTGAAEFEVTLPDYFVGQPLEKGNALVKLDVSVVDTAEHQEKATRTFSVANHAIHLAAVPESGTLVPGVENRLFVLATSPDGSPVECEVSIEAGREKRQGRTNDSGFVALPFTPKKEDLITSSRHRGRAALKVKIRGQDPKGNKADQEVELFSEYGEEQILMRLDKAIYRAGDIAEISVFSTSASGRVFLDAVKGGQTALTSAVTLDKGQASYRLHIPESLFGTLEIHAYRLMADGEIVRDSRVLYVHPPKDLRIEAALSKQSFRPAEQATIDFRVTDGAGKGVSAALGVIVVDESVYALADMQPGLEKVYFMLAKELQEPKVQLKFGEPIQTMIQDPGIPARRQEVAAILMAPVEPEPRRWQANTIEARMVEWRPALQRIYHAMSEYIGAKNEFWQVNAQTKSREFRADLLKQLKLEEKDRIDPWGNAVSMDQLARIDDAFSFGHWARLMSAKNVAEIFELLKTWIVAKDVLDEKGIRKGVLEEMLAAKALQKEQTTDYFGEPFTLERLAKEEPALREENLEKLTASLRKEAIFNALRAHCRGQRGLRSDGTYEPGVLEKLGVNLSKPRGGLYTLDALAAESKAFDPANMAKVVTLDRKAAIFAAIVSEAAQAGWDSVAREGRYVDGLVDRLLRNRRLGEAEVADASGRPFDLEALVKEDPRFGAKVGMAGLLNEKVQKIANAICSHIHNGGTNDLPADWADRLLRQKGVTETDLTDPWGTRLRIVDREQNEAAQLSCGLLSDRKVVLCAGPDRKFGTADDLRIGQHHGERAYTPDYSGCLLYAHESGLAWSAYRPDRSKEKKNGGDGRLSAVGNWGALPPKPEPGKPDPGRNFVPGLELESKELPYNSGGSQPTIRVREYFPETLLWKPILLTDEQGRARLAVDLADSITTWMLTASANTAGGLLGSTTTPILVFQPFFVDIDFPVSLTQNDAVSVPVAVYNYLKEPQRITLKVDREEWFTIVGEAEKQVDLKPGEVRAVHFRVQVKGLGHRKLTVYAWGKDEAARDAIRRQVEVVPDGKMVEVVINQRLAEGIDQAIEIPANAIPGSFKIFAKCHPGVFSQIVEGVEGMLGAPHG
jgi:hypothetical protein